MNDQKSWRGYEGWKKENGREELLERKSSQTELTSNSGVGDESKKIGRDSEKSIENVSHFSIPTSKNCRIWLREQAMQAERVRVSVFRLFSHRSHKGTRKKITFTNILFLCDYHLLSKVLVVMLVLLHSYFPISQFHLILCTRKTLDPSFLCMDGQEMSPKDMTPWMIPLLKHRRGRRLFDQLEREDDIRWGRDFIMKEDATEESTTENWKFLLASFFKWQLSLHKTTYFPQGKGHWTKSILPEKIDRKKRTFLVGCWLCFLFPCLLLTDLMST